MSEQLEITKEVSIRQYRGNLNSLTTKMQKTRIFSLIGVVKVMVWSLLVFGEQPQKSKRKITHICWQCKILNSIRSKEVTTMRGSTSLNKT